MGFRFQKRIKIAPGIKLNLSKSGISTSIGGRGFTHNIGHGKRRTTIGIPGTGLSHSAEHSTGHQAQAVHTTPASDAPSTQDIVIGWAIAITIVGLLIYFFG